MVDTPKDGFCFGDPWGLRRRSPPGAEEERRRREKTGSSGCEPARVRNDRVFDRVQISCGSQSDLRRARAGSALTAAVSARDSRFCPPGKNDRFCGHREARRGNAQHFLDRSIPLYSAKQKTIQRDTFHKAGFTCRNTKGVRTICSYSFSHALPCKE